MRSENLQIAAALHGLSAADLAKIAGVSRQMASRWLRGDKEQFAVGGERLVRLAQRLGIPVERLIDPLPASLRGELLWDGLYPDLVAFSRALWRGEERALARLVETYGFFEARRIGGERAISAFPDYKKLIPPARRRELENLWKTLFQTKIWRNESSRPA